MTDRVTRRDFLASTAAATAIASTAGTVLAAAPVALTRGEASDPQDYRFIHLFLPGGWPCNDLWDPKPFAPFRQGMRGSELTATVQSITTACSNIHLGESLYMTATIMDRGTLVRSLVDDASNTDHASAQANMCAALSFDEEITLIDVDTTRTDGLAQALLAASKLTAKGVKHVRVTRPFEPFQRFDAHEYGSKKLQQMMKNIDISIAAIVWQLEGTGELDRTVLCISSEFNRTIAGVPASGSDRNTGENLIISHERDYGFHVPFTQANSILFFGGRFKRGYVFGRTAPKHPMRVVENPVTLPDIHATLAHALGRRARDGRVIDALLA